MMQEEFLSNISDLLNSKRAQYGDTDLKVSQMLNILYPDGVGIKNYFDLQFTIKILEKLSRLSSQNISDEATYDLLQDIAGYGILGTFLKRKQRNDEDTDTR